MQLSIIVPTFNEAPNVDALLHRIQAATAGIDAEVIFVDDSTDETPDVIADVAGTLEIPVSCVHRDTPDGGLGGAVVVGIRQARARHCLVMDGDLQHPPEMIPEIYERAHDADVVVASRYAAGGGSDGLSGWLRHAVSRSSTLVTKAMFPVRLRDCSDPMTGFFLVDREAVNVSALHPQGFKILLEILARQNLRVSEVPFTFAERGGGASKASVRQGARFLWQLAVLKFGRMSGFAAIGALGALLNILLVWILTSLGMHFVVASVVAAETTIIGNFVLQERLVFRDLREQAAPLRTRFLASFAFNNAEAALRIPIVYAMVESWHFSAVLATAVTLLVAFVVRFTFQSLVVYAPRKSRGTVDAEPADGAAARGSGTDRRL